MDFNKPFENLKDKTCVVTGGAGGIGSAIAESMAAVGIKTVILGRNENKAKDFAASLEHKYSTGSLGVGCDVLNKKELEDVNKVVTAKFGTVDYLINCAGGNHPKATASVEQVENLKKDFEESFLGFTEEGMDFVFNLNFKGTVLPSMVFGSGMIEQGYGAIINISSVAAFLPVTRGAMYSAAKEAINNFTKWLSVHFAKTGVRVNAIAPGFFLTDQNRFLLLDENGDKTERGEKIINNTPMGRYGDVNDLGGTALYLVSDLAEFITGAVVPVDGGFTAFGRV